MSNKKIFKPLNNYIYTNERNEEKKHKYKNKNKSHKFKNTGNNEMVKYDRLKNNVSNPKQNHGNFVTLL